MDSAKGETPKTYSLRITENALQNIDEITGYIAYVKHQPLNAIRVGDKIFETIEKIEKIHCCTGNVKKFKQKRKFTGKRFV